jgi:hypothetical protein
MVILAEALMSVEDVDFENSQTRIVLTRSTRYITETVEGDEESFRVTGLI